MTENWHMHFPFFSYNLKCNLIYVSKEKLNEDVRINKLI